MITLRSPAVYLPPPPSSLLYCHIVVRHCYCYCWWRGNSLPTTFTLLLGSHDSPLSSFNLPTLQRLCMCIGDEGMDGGVKTLVLNLTLSKVHASLPLLTVKTTGGKSEGNKKRSRRSFAGRLTRPQVCLRCCEFFSHLFFLTPKISTHRHTQTNTHTRCHIPNHVNN